MVRRIESQGYNGGADFTNLKVRLRATTGATIGNGGTASKENLRPSAIEVRLADLGTDKDIKAITGIFGQASVIEHLSGVAPVGTSRNIERFRKKLPELMPGIDVDANEVIIATEKEIGNYFRYKDPTKTKLLIAQSIGSDPKILGTVTVEKPGGGIAIASISKLAVSEDAREKGVGSALIQTATAFALCKVEDGGWGYRGASAGIIQVNGSERPQRLFLRNRYLVQATRPNGCIGWDNKLGQFVYRDVLLVHLNGENYTSDPSFLPKKAA